MNWFLISKTDSENWKCPIFDSPQSKGLTRYHIIFLEGSFNCKNLLNFTCTTKKFHNCHHTNVGWNSDVNEKKKEKNVTLRHFYVGISITYNS